MKRNVIDALFLPHEASIIKLPLHQQYPYDIIICDCSKCVSKVLIFLLKQCARADVGESSNPDSSKSIWRAVWTTNIPNKIKVFSWRVKLFDKKISSTVTCELCKEEPETCIHVL
jgi:hypothetical protein